MQHIDVLKLSIATRKQFEIVGIAATACREESLNNLIVDLVVGGQLPVEIVGVVPKVLMLLFNKLVRYFMKQAIDIELTWLNHHFVQFYVDWLKGNGAICICSLDV